MLSDQSAITSQLTYTVDELKRRGLDVRFVLSPEHGFWGTGDPGEVLGDKYDNVLGLVVKDVYDREEGFKALEETDSVVVDIQDAGVRFYTYVTAVVCITAVMQTLEHSSRHGISSVIILDRPNPLSGSVIEGPLLKGDCGSYVGYFEIPLRYWLTIGELSLYHNEEKSLGLDISVVSMLGYSRSLDIMDLDLAWVPPSPAIPERDRVYLSVSRVARGDKRK